MDVSTTFKYSTIAVAPWEDHTFSTPSLDITAFYLPEDGSIYGYDWEHPETHIRHFNNASQAQFVDGNTQLSGADLESRGRCQTGETVSYRWGFSFSLLFTLTLLLVLWSLASAVIWHISTRGLQSHNFNPNFGDFKAIVLIAKEITVGLKITNDDLLDWTEDEIRGELQSQGGPPMKCAVSKASLVKGCRLTRSQLSKLFWQWFHSHYITNVTVVALLVAGVCLHLFTTKPRSQGPGIGSLLVISSMTLLISSFGGTVKRGTVIFVAILPISVAIGIASVIDLKQSMARR
jgi:hypothetical protein